MSEGNIFRDAAKVYQQRLDSVDGTHALGLVGIEKVVAQKLQIGYAPADERFLSQAIQENYGRAAMRQSGLFVMDELPVDVLQNKLVVPLGNGTVQGIAALEGETAGFGQFVTPGDERTALVQGYAQAILAFQETGKTIYGMNSYDSSLELNEAEVELIGSTDFCLEAGINLLRQGIDSMHKGKGLIEYLLEEMPGESTKERLATTRSLVPLAQASKNPLARGAYLSTLARYLGSEVDLRMMVKEFNTPKTLQVQAEDKILASMMCCPDLRPHLAQEQLQDVFSTEEHRFLYKKMGEDEAWRPGLYAGDMGAGVSELVAKCELIGNGQSLQELTDLIEEAKEDNLLRKKRDLQIAILENPAESESYYEELGKLVADEKKSS